MSSRASRKAKALTCEPISPPTSPAQTQTNANVTELHGGLMHPIDRKAWQYAKLASGNTNADYLRLAIQLENLDNIPVNSVDGFRRVTLESQKKTKDKTDHIQASVDAPIGLVHLDWTADAIQRALNAHEIGQFHLSAQLCDAMIGDARITHAINVSSKGFMKLQPYMTAPKRAKNQKLAVHIAEEMQEVYPDMVTAEMAELLIFRQRLMGFCLHNVTWEDNQGLVLPNFRHYHEMWTFFYMAAELENRVLQAITMSGGDPKDAGTAPIRPDDEDWFLYAPFGAYRGWLRAGCQQVAIPWLVRNLALRDCSRLGEAHGMPIRMITVPASMPEEDKMRVYNEAKNMGSEAVFILPVGADGSGIKMELLELRNTRSYEVMKTIWQRADSDIEIALAGTQLLGALGDASSAGKSSSMAASKEVRSEQDDFSFQDSVRFAQAFRKGPLRRTVLYNHGQEANDCVPLFTLSDEPPSDKAQTAKAWSDLGSALVQFKNVGIKIDAPLITAINEEFGTKFSTELAEPPDDEDTDTPLSLNNRGSMIVQSVLISKDEYSLDQAKSWLEAHDYQTGVDEKQDSFRFRQREPKDFNPQSFRTVEITKGIKFVIGRLKRDEQQPTDFVQNYVRHPRGQRHDEGQAYVNNVPAK